MRTRNVIIMALLLAGMLVSCDLFDIVEGSGNLQTRDFSFSEEYTAIEVDNQSKVDVTQGDSFSVTVTADDNLYEYIIVEVDGGTLRVSLQDSINYSDITYEVDVVLPSLTSLDVDGVSSLRLEDFVIDGNMYIRVDGVSAVDALGSSVNGNLNLVVNGVSEARLGGLVVDGNCTVDVDGVSSARVNLTGTVYGTLSGVSSLDYTGGTLDSTFEKDSITCDVNLY